MALMASKLASDDDPNLERTCLRYGIPPLRGEKLAQSELSAWTAPMLSHVFDKIPRLSDVPDTVKRPYFWQNQHWIKPPDWLVRKAAKLKLALCINASGDWKLMPTGYVAMSHVWEDGLYADPKNRGLPRAVIDQLFVMLRPLKVKWIWLDSLAIPGGRRDLSLEETIVKVNLINNMYSIYSNANFVVVMDALLLQLQSRSPVIIAVALLLSRWASRVWTFQEVKMAPHAVVITKAGPVHLQRVLAWLKGMSDKDPAKMAPIYKSLHRLLRSKTTPVSVLDVALSCAERETHDDIDYSRGVYGCLGLTWDEKYTREDGMQHIMASSKEDAARLLGMHGSPLLVDGYAWAPAYFSGLRGSLLLDVSWENNGLRRPFYSHAVELIRKKRLFPWSRSTSLFLKFPGLGDDTTCECRLSSRENPDAINGFEAAMLCKEAILLSQASLEHVKLPLRYNPPLTVLLVKKGRAKNEAFIYMTAALTSLTKAIPACSESWLIYHEGPRNGSLNDDILPNPVMIYSALPHREETDVHRMIRFSQDLATEHLLLSSDQDIGDAAGWTPLHLASFLGRTETLQILLAAGASTQRVENELSLTPLHLAVIAQNASCTSALIQAKADVNKAANRNLTPLMLAVKGGNIHVIRILIDAGAQVSIICDSKHQTALHMAVELGNTAALKLLLEAPNAREALRHKDHQGLTIGWIAARSLDYDSSAVISRSVGLTSVVQNVSAESLSILKEAFLLWLLGIMFAVLLDITMLIRGKHQELNLHPSLASLWGRFRGPAETLFWTLGISSKSLERHRMWIGAAFKFFDLMSPGTCPQRYGLAEPLFCTMHSAYFLKTSNLIFGMVSGTVVTVLVLRILPFMICVLFLGGIHRYYRRSIYGQSVDESIRAFEKGNEWLLGLSSVILGGLQLTLLPSVVYYSCGYTASSLGIAKSTVFFHAFLIIGIGTATNVFFRKEMFGELLHQRIKNHAYPLQTIRMALIQGFVLWIIIMAIKFAWQGMLLPGELLLSTMLGLRHMHIYIKRLILCVIFGQISYHLLWNWLAKEECYREIYEEEQKIGWLTYFSKTTELGLRVYVLIAACLTIIKKTWEMVGFGP